MEHEKHKEVKQSTLQFRCVKKTHSEKSGGHPVANVQIKSDENQGCGISFAFPTPEKTIQPPKIRKSKEHSYHLRKESGKCKMLPDEGGNNELVAEAHDKMECTDVSFSKSFEQSPCMSGQSLEENCQLSEKYKVIDELFSKMIISVRLLGLRKRLASFQNISSQAEVLAKKKFLLSHLAQMKFLFSEALHIEKTLIHDEKGHLNMCKGTTLAVVVHTIDTFYHIFADLELGIRCPEGHALSRPSLICRLVGWPSH